MLGLVRHLIGNSRGNVAIIFALCAVPMTFLVGMGVDYGSAALRNEQLSAIADSAALAAVTTSKMAGPDSGSVTAATNAFNAQASQISGINYNSSNLAVSVVDSITTRTVTVTYTASSIDAFPNVLSKASIPLHGQSQAVGQSPPNINFYLLLDTSPSMAIAATQSGITTMVNNTSSQGGCAFGCHQSNPAPDNLGNPGGEDNYALARSLGVSLRIDVLGQAAQNLMTTAQQTENTNHATYQMAIYTFDVAFNTIGAMTSNLTSAQAEASTISLLKVYDNNNLTSGNNNNDEDTNYDNAMSNINSTMTTPGNGTNASGDKPQEVLFFVTDGVEDENVSGGRQQSVMNPSWCTTIKNRGIRIAVLYTTYYPLPTNSWYNSYIAPIQNNIGPTLQSCASPGLYYEVSTGGDISSALSSLFQTAVSTAHLSQ